MKAHNNRGKHSLVLSLVIGVALVLAGLLSASAPSAAQGVRSLLIPPVPTPGSVNPAANALNVPPDADLSITYGGNPIDPSSVTTRTFPAFGSQSPIFEGTYTIPTQTLTFDPDRDFFPGERIDASATTGITSLGGESVPYPIVWQFWTAAEPGSAWFGRHPVSPTFGTGPSYDAALGDLDGDGDLDAFVVNGGGSISNTVWLNDNSGGFVLNQVLPDTYSDSEGVALGDLDSDGDLDAFVANGSGTTPNTVWFNDGSGAFTDSGQTLSSMPSYDVALGDLDGDGDLDAFVANGSFSVANRVWVNDGSGVFTDSGQNIGSNDSEGVALGDFDGDGDLDAFVANGSGPTPNKVWLNDGSGTFTDSGQNMGTFPSYDVDVGDLDNDGDLDAFVANTGSLPAGANRVWINDGTGVFTVTQLMGGSPSKGVKLGDLDGDGDLDALVANNTRAPATALNEVWTNDGRGRFTPGQRFDTGSSENLALGDVDGDGDLDAVFANWGANTVWLNLDPAGLEPAPNSHTAPTTTNLTATFDSAIDPASVTTETLVVHGDFHGRLGGALSVGSIVFDPDDDFFPGELVETTVTTGVTELDGTPVVPTVWQFRTAAPWGSGVLVSPTISATFGSGPSYNVDLGDLDGDGDLDAFVADGGGLNLNTVWRNNGAAGFDLAQILASRDSENVSLGDLDGDGDLDAFVANGSGYTPNYVWFNDGNLSFTEGGSYGMNPTYDIALGDLDADGDLDAFAANGSFSYPNYVYINDGSGVFTATSQVLGNNDSEGVALGDLDGDGDLDAFVANGSGATPNKVWWNDGSGRFFDSGQNLSLNPSYDVALGDLDGDGDLDAFVANSGANRVWLNGNGVFTDSGQSLGSAPSRDVSLGDFDGDGDLDALVANGGAFTAANVLWLNDGSGSFTAAQTLPLSRSGGLAVGDLDGDEDLDAVIANDGVEEVWLNKTCEIYLPLILSN